MTLRSTTVLPQRRGYAMGLFLVVLTVLTTTVVMLLNTAATESRNSYRQEQLTNAKLEGLAAIDGFYARLQNVPGFPGSAVDPSQTVDVFTPGTTPTRWFRLQDPNSSGTGAGKQIVNTCVEAVEPCYQLFTDLTQRRDPVMKVTAKVRYNCRGEDNCNYLYLTQRLRAWQFTDFLFYTEYNVIAPRLASEYGTIFPSRPDTSVSPDPCAKPWSQRVGLNSTDDCPVIAYTTNDKVEGPVFTNDEFILVCGTPDFEENLVYARPKTGEAMRSASDLGIADCGTTPTAGALKASQSLRLPPSRSTFLTVRESNDDVRDIGGKNSGQRTEITFSGRDLEYIEVSNASRVCASRPNKKILLEDDQVVTVAGDAVICGGVFEGRSSLFVQGKVTVVDDLTYTSRTGPDSDVLGINAGDDIEILSEPGPCPTGTDTFKLDAILISLGGTVYAGDMLPLLQPGECAQTLEFYGAVASKYQGVYGLYDSAGGAPVAGFVKKFTHDDRSAYDLRFLPPRIVSPSGLQWMRLDLAEVRG